MSKKKKTKIADTGQARIPKGEMCLTCRHMSADCSSLPFDMYPRIEIDEEFVTVRCMNFWKDQQFERLKLTDEQKKFLRDVDDLLHNDDPETVLGGKREVDYAEVVEKLYNVIVKLEERV